MTAPQGSLGRARGLMRLLRTAARAVVKSGLAACESSLFAALLCGTAAALGVVSGLSLLAALLVDACKCAQGTRTLVLLRPSSVPASAIKTLGAKKMQRLVFSHLAPPAPAF